AARIAGIKPSVKARPIPGRLQRPPFHRRSQVRGARGIGRDQRNKRDASRSLIGVEFYWVYFNPSKSNSALTVTVASIDCFYDLRIVRFSGRYGPKNIPQARGHQRFGDSCKQPRVQTESRQANTSY